MKIKVLIALLISLAAIGCKKNKNESLITNIKYPINFNVTNTAVAVNIGKPGKNVSALPDTTHYLYYQLYDSNDNMIKRIYQTSVIPGYGNISDSIPAGNYKIAFFEGKKIAYHTVTDTSFAAVEPFFKKINVVIPGQPASSNLSLDRIYAQLEVNIEDAIPANVTKITVNVGNEKTYFSILNDAAPRGTTTREFSKNVVTANIGITNFKLLSDMFNTAVPFTVKIKATGTNGFVIEKTVNNVTCTRNMKTILTGNLFTAADPGGFKVTLDKAFSTDTIRVDF